METFVNSVISKELDACVEPDLTPAQIKNCKDGVKEQFEKEIPQLILSAPSSTTFDIKYTMPGGALKSLITKTVNH